MDVSRASRKYNCSGRFRTLASRPHIQKDGQVVKTRVSIGTRKNLVLLSVRRPGWEAAASPVAEVQLCMFHLKRKGCCTLACRLYRWMRTVGGSSSRGLVPGPLHYRPNCPSTTIALFERCVIAAVPLVPLLAVGGSSLPRRSWRQKPSSTMSTGRSKCNFSSADDGQM